MTTGLLALFLVYYVSAVATVPWYTYRWHFTGSRRFIRRNERYGRLILYVGGPIFYPFHAGWLMWRHYFPVWKRSFEEKRLVLKHYFH
jgi:hypothetical protein